jgi:hypothetical protein
LETTEEIVNANTYPDVKVKFTPSDKNYAEAYESITVTVNPAKVSVKKVNLETKTVSQVKDGTEAELSDAGVQLNGLKNGDTFDDVAGIKFTSSYKATNKKGTQKISYTITLTSPNYTFGGKGDGTTKTGTASAKVSAG